MSYIRDWQYVFKRRKWLLENYLSDCVTVQDAQAKFERGGMSCPTLEILLSHGLKNTSGETEATPASEPAKDSRKSAVAAPARRHREEVKADEQTDEAKNEYDPLVVIETTE